MIFCKEKHEIIIIIIFIDNLLGLIQSNRKQTAVCLFFCSTCRTKLTRCASVQAAPSPHTQKREGHTHTPTRTPTHTRVLTQTHRNILCFVSTSHRCSHTGGDSATRLLQKPGRVYQPALPSVDCGSGVYAAERACAGVGVCETVKPIRGCALSSYVRLYLQNPICCLKGCCFFFVLFCF